MPVQLKVIAIIVAFFVFIFSMQIKVCVDYDGEFNYAIKYLFFTFRIKDKGKGKTTRKKKKKKEKEPQKLSIDKVRYFIDLFKKLWEKTQPLLTKLAKSLKVNKLIVDLTIGGDDAAMTAIYYGEACAAVFPAVSILENLVKVKKKQISVRADFNNDSTLLFNVNVGIRVGKAVAIGISGAIKVISVLISNPIKIKKGELNHERTSDSEFNGHHFAENP